MWSAWQARGALFGTFCTTGHVLRNMTVGNHIPLHFTPPLLDRLLRTTYVVLKHTCVVHALQSRCWLHCCCAHRWAFTTWD